jgi:hypothetical protein
MKSEALDATAGHTMRPSALDAATTRTPADIRESVDNTSSKEEHVSALPERSIGAY